DFVDDGPAIGLHPAGVDLTHKNKPASQVAADHRLEALGRNGLHRRSILTAGIIHEPIDTAVGAEHSVDGSDHHRYVTDIANLTDDHARPLRSPLSPVRVFRTC